MMELQINKLPTLQELYAEPKQALKTDHLAVILNQQPPATWIKTHPFIKGYNYLPIDKIEFLLKRIFKRYRIEILREGTSFNGVYVVVRVHYLHPVTNEWDFHDGIGAVQLQTAKGTSPADLININNGALSMAYPIAKTIAIKDACDHFGTTFGSDLNRKDTIQYSADAKLADVAKSKEEERLEKLIEKAKDLSTLEGLKSHLTESLNSQYEIKWNQLSK
jgi:hypothetical protein